MVVSMPEYQTNLVINYWAQDGEDAIEVSRDLATMVFVDDCVNSVGDSIPVLVKEDD
jgi:hypothetical protein